MSSRTELAALSNRIKLDSAQADAIRAGIAAKRAQAVAEAEEAAKNALTLSKPVTPASASLVSGQFAKFLNEKDTANESRLLRIMKNMAEIAESKQPKAIEAARFLLEYAHGKPKPSEEALDAISKGGIQLIYVAAPDVPAGEERKALPAKPDFIDAEFETEEDDNG